MKINNFILSFLSPILCIYLLRILWTLSILFLLVKFDYTLFFSIIEFLSPFISYWFLKKYFSKNNKIQTLFFDYVSVKKYAISLFVIESFILLLLLIIGVDLATIIFIYLIFLIYYFSFIWYLPFLIMAFINRNNKL